MEERLLIMLDIDKILKLKETRQTVEFSESGHHTKAALLVAEFEMSRIKCEHD